MGEKGVTRGTADYAKVIARTGRHPPRATHDGTRGFNIVIECCGAKQKMLACPLPLLCLQIQHK